MKNVLQLEMCHPPPTTALYTPCPDDQLKKISQLFLCTKNFFSFRLRFSKLDTILKSNIILLLLEMNLFIIIKISTVESLKRTKGGDHSLENYIAKYKHS